MGCPAFVMNAGGRFGRRRKKDRVPPKDPNSAPRPNDSSLVERARAALGERPLILAGFMGVGKTTVGRTLARLLDRRFIDTDAEIERETGLSVSRIFEERGEAAFREMESEIARNLADRTDRVIATGGGFMVREENRRLATEAGEVFLLEATTEQIWERVRRHSRRPLLKTPDPRGRIEALLKERAAAYAALPRRVSTDGKTPEEVAREILEQLAESAKF